MTAQWSYYNLRFGIEYTDRQGWHAPHLDQTMHRLGLEGWELVGFSIFPYIHGGDGSGAMAFGGGQFTVNPVNVRYAIGWAVFKRPR